MRRKSMAYHSRHEAIVNWAERFGLATVWLLMIALFGLLLPNSFLSWANISSILGSQSVLVVVALGLIIPLTAGDFDMSIAAVLALSAMTVAVTNVWLGFPISLAILTALSIGLLIGAINAFFILYFRIHSLIVTLGTGAFAQGVILWMSGSHTITGVDRGLVQMVIINRLFGIPFSFYYAIAIAVVVGLMLSRTAFGQWLLFVGRGREVARLSGIRVDRVRAAALLSSAFLGSIAGVLYAGTTGAADPSSGLSYALPGFAAAFLGATSVVPGRFNAVGSVLAVYFLVTGISGLSMMGLDSYVQNLFYGGALILAVALSQVVRGREERMN